MPPFSKYFASARARARRRKSPWNLLLIPAAVVLVALIWWSMVAAFGHLHAELYDGQGLVGAHGIGPVLMSVAPLFAALPLAMLAGNVIVRCVPPARRALDLEAESQAGTGFSAAQRQLSRLAMIVVPVALCIALLGALLPW